jgi:hypothetical protein
MWFMFHFYSTKYGLCLTFLLFIWLMFAFYSNLCRLRLTYNLFWNVYGLCFTFIVCNSYWLCLTDNLF